MGLKSTISIPFARYQVAQAQKAFQQPLKTQEKVFSKLLATLKKTAFGADHHLNEVNTMREFQEAVPMRDYEALRPYIDRVRQGEADVLWAGKPIYFCKTSGTTSGSKFIPISKASISNHIRSARNALLHYIAETRKAGFVDGKMIFLQGSPVLGQENGIATGRLSGIVAHHVPGYLQRNRMPSFATNSIEDWEEKVDGIVDETLKADMRLISGIPPWVQMYFERLLERSGKNTIAEVFPQFSLFVYGGVSYGPYRAIFDRLIGRKVDSIEVYPASEGFLAYQDSQATEGLQLVLDDGIYYEFIPVDEALTDNPRRLSLAEVELGVNYLLVLNTNAGLWGYNIGDTVRFVSLFPHRIVVTGRLKHFISAFGEHVIAEEVESAMRQAQEETGAEVVEFHVAPMVQVSEGLPYHEWFVEFSRPPADLAAFAARIDALMQQKNTYYYDLVDGNMLKPLVISSVKKGGFTAMMRSRGKLGGQNKTPRLANDRAVADLLTPHCT